MGDSFSAMSGARRLFALALALLVCGLCSQAFAVEVEVERVVDLTSTRVEDVVVYSLTNTNSQPLADFEVAVLSDNLSHLEINLLASDERKENVDHRVSASRELAGNTYQIFTVSFAQPIAPSASVSIYVRTVHTHTLTPKPQALRQDEMQRMLWNGNAHTVTVVPTRNQVTAIRTMKIVDYSKEISVESSTDQQLNLSFEDVPAFSVQPFWVHAYNTARFITVDRLVKEIEVSHWGNVAVEESWNLHHAGALLKGTFSRLDYMRGAAGNSVREFVQWLPKGAVDLYYRDIIGNISTSHAFPHEENVKFEIQPRFVMFGGWKNEFKTGYNLPSSRYLSVEDDGTYVLSLPFLNDFEDAVVDEIEVRVVLPEGVKDVKITSPVHTTEHSESVRPTYLDTSGRLVFTLRASNLVAEHRQHNLVVTYRFSTSAMIQEPLLLVGAYFILFVVAIIIFHSDFRIDNSSTGLVSETDMKARKIITELSETLQKLESKFELGTTDTQKALQKKMEKFNVEVNAASSRVRVLISNLSVLRPELGDRARRVEQLFKDKSNAFRKRLSFNKTTGEQAKQEILRLNNEFSQASSALRHEIQDLLTAGNQSEE